MLVDRSSRVWAMRRDDVVSAHAIQMRAEHFDAESPRALISGEWLEGSDFARVVDGVAIIPVYGPLMRSFNWWAWSYEEIARDLALAEASSLVRQIVLDIDSPGGLAAGCGDCAALIRDCSKPVTAFVGGMAASAAYWLASACGAGITVGSGAILGSVGAVIEYVDIEPMFEKMGARIIRVVAEQSPNKRLDPESPEGKAELQALVDASGAEFVAGVAEGRGVAEATVMADFGQGLVFDGAEALRRGMADQRGTLPAIVSGLAARDVPPNAAPAPAAQETPMEWASLTLAALREHRPDLVTSIETAASATAMAERERILGIEEIDAGGHEDLVAAAKADGKTSPADLALAIMKAEKKAGATLLAGREAADATAAVPSGTPKNTTTATAGGAEDQAKAAWDKDEKLRAEFGDDFDSYKAFAKAEASGRARILKRAG